MTRRRRLWHRTDVSRIILPRECNESTVRSLRHEGQCKPSIIGVAHLVFVRVEMLQMFSCSMPSHIVSASETGRGNFLKLRSCISNLSHCDCDFTSHLRRHAAPNISSSPLAADCLPMLPHKTFTHHRHEHATTPFIPESCRPQPPLRQPQSPKNVRLAQWPGQSLQRSPTE